MKDSLKEFTEEMAASDEAAGTVLVEAMSVLQGVREFFAALLQLLTQLLTEAPKTPHAAMLLDAICEGVESVEDAVIDFADAMNDVEVRMCDWHVIGFCTALFHTVWAGAAANKHASPKQG